MSETTYDMLVKQLEATRENLAGVWEAIDAGAEEYDGTDPHEWLDESPLEIVWETGEPFAVVLGTGGPHYEITGGGRQGGYVLTGYWGGEEVTLSGQAITRAGEYFRDMVEGQ